MNPDEQQKQDMITAAFDHYMAAAMAGIAASHQQSSSITTLASQIATLCLQARGPEVEKIVATSNGSGEEVIAERVNVFDQYMGSAVTGLCAGTKHPKPETVAHLSAGIAAEAMRARSAFQQKALGVTPAAPLGNGGAFPPPAGQVTSSIGAIQQSDGVPTDAQLQRMAKLGLTGEICPICHGKKTEASKTAHPQCQMTHYPPHGAAKQMIGPSVPAPTPGGSGS